MSKNILITGGLGYIGGRVAKFLSANSSCWLRLTTIDPIPTKLNWLKSGEIIHMDVLNPEDLQRACYGIDTIIHLAALNENVCANDPERALLINGLGTVKLLDQAKKTGIKRIIYFSTAHVYGAPLIGTITENTLPRPAHPYAITHKVAEDFILATHDKNILEGIVLRLSNGFGAPVTPNVDRWTLLINDLAKQIVMQKHIQLQSSGLQRRDFITLEDVSRAVLHFINLPKAIIGDGLFNVGGECSMRVVEVAALLAERCMQLFGFTPQIVKPEVADPQEHDTALNYAINKLKMTGFTLNKNIQQEIDGMLLFCDKHFGT
jgi:UDP-glucose 4-epimerase